ncbi:lamin tail domain-containing protein [Clostridium sp. DL1XJH146]
MKKLLKFFLWIVLFPFRLINWGLNKKRVIAIAAVLSVVLFAVGCDEAISNKTEENVNGNKGAVEQQEERVDTEAEEDKLDGENIEESVQNNNVSGSGAFEGYRLIEVEGGDQSGYREANVVVDIGFGDREYYAFTNGYGQLVKVTAEKITLQDEATEQVLASGRYYPDEAKVPGVESSTLDEGHVIADSLGGVSNAYNITPQESTLNRQGDQAYMEKVIRDAGGCTDFVAVITYEDTSTQIPSHYSYTYTIEGNTINDEFDNVNPDEDTTNNNETIDTDNEVITSDEQIKIVALDKKAEYIILKNLEDESVNLKGWTILSVKGEQSFTFPEFTLEPNSTVKIGDSSKNSDVDFHWLDGTGTWNNTKSDPAELYNPNGKLVDRYND